METKDRAPIIEQDNTAQWRARGGAEARDALPPARLPHDRQVAMLRACRRRLADSEQAMTDQLRDMGAE